MEVGRTVGNHGINIAEEKISSKIEKVTDKRTC